MYYCPQCGKPYWEHSDYACSMRWIFDPEDVEGNTGKWIESFEGWEDEYGLE